MLQLNAMLKNICPRTSDWENSRHNYNENISIFKCGSNLLRKFQLLYTHGNLSLTFSQPSTPTPIVNWHMSLLAECMVPGI